MGILIVISLALLELYIKQTWEIISEKKFFTAMYVFKLGRHFMSVVACLIVPYIASYLKSSTNLCVVGVLLEVPIITLLMMCKNPELD